MIETFAVAGVFTIVLTLPTLIAHIYAKGFEVSNDN